MTTTFIKNHLLVSIVSNAIWSAQASHNHWLSGVRVHGDGEGAAIDFSVIDLNMEFVLASTNCCVRHLILEGRRHRYCYIGNFPRLTCGCDLKATGGCGMWYVFKFSSDILSL